MPLMQGWSLHFWIMVIMRNVIISFGIGVGVEPGFAFCLNVSSVSLGKLL